MSLIFSGLVRLTALNLYKNMSIVLKKNQESCVCDRKNHIFQFVTSICLFSMQIHLLYILLYDWFMNGIRNQKEALCHKHVGNKCFVKVTLSGSSDSRQLLSN